MTAIALSFCVWNISFFFLFFFVLSLKKEMILLVVLCCRVVVKWMRLKKRNGGLSTLWMREEVSSEMNDVILSWERDKKEKRKNWEFAAGRLIFENHAFVIEPSTRRRRRLLLGLGRPVHLLIAVAKAWIYFNITDTSFLWENPSRHVSNARSIVHIASGGCWSILKFNRKLVKNIQIAC